MTVLATKLFVCCRYSGGEWRLLTSCEAATEEATRHLAETSLERWQDNYPDLRGLELAIREEWQ